MAKKQPIIVGECDKCGGPVFHSNDVRNAWIAILGKDVCKDDKPRHLMSVKGCEGSPSARQYLADQPRDNREGMPEYNPAYEEPIRTAVANARANGYTTTE